MATEELVKAVMATAQVMGTELSRDSARMFVSDLSEYPEPLVFDALSACRREVKGKLTLADVVTRIDDGRPGANEAWAMIPRSEAETVVWSEEMALAMKAAQPLLTVGDQVAARMAFIEAYQREVTQARREKRPVKWTPSLGHDAWGREHVLKEAVAMGRLTQERATALLPHIQFYSPDKKLLPVSSHVKALLENVKKTETEG